MCVPRRKLKWCKYEIAPVAHVSDASSYNLKRSTSSASETNLLNTTGTSYTDTGVANGTTYYYVVSSLNAGGEGNNSREASATPQNFATAFWTNKITSAPQSWDANANWTNVSIYPNATNIFVNVTADIAAPAWTVGGGNTDATFAGIISGNSITKIGTGIWTLSGNNTYTGATTISGGALQIGAGGNTGTLGTANVTDNAALIFNRFDNVICSNLISGSGSLTQAGDGVLTLAAANTYSGPTYISAGTLALNNSGSIGNSTNINLANGALFDVSAVTIHTVILPSGKMLSGDGSVNGNFTVASGATLAPGNNDLGALSFSNSLTLNSGSKTILQNGGPTHWRTATNSTASTSTK
jgi:autotransporter-associated beta strand protein